MNKNTSGAVLVLILAAAGLFYDKPAAWGLAALTAALAFLAEDLKEVSMFAAFFVALASWATVVGAAVALAI